MVIDVAIFIVVLMLLVLMILLPSSDDSASLGSTSVNDSAPSLSNSFTIHLESADSYPTCRNRYLISTYPSNVSRLSTRVAGLSSQLTLLRL